MAAEAILYRPILDGIDARESELVTRQNAAATAQARAEAAEAEQRAQIAAFDANKATMLERARSEVQRTSQKLRDEAHADLAAEFATRREKMDEAQRVFCSNLHASGAHALLSMASKALRDLADVKLEDQIAAHVETQLVEVGKSLLDTSGPVSEAVVSTHVAALGKHARAIFRSVSHCRRRCSIALRR